jgi:hypothetical protein
MSNEFRFGLGWALWAAALRSNGFAVIADWFSAYFVELRAFGIGAIGMAAGLNMHSCPSGLRTFASSMGSAEECAPVGGPIHRALYKPEPGGFQNLIAIGKDRLRLGVPAPNAEVCVLLTHAYGKVFTGGVYG